MKGIYKYTDLTNGDVVYVGKDSHIDKNHRHNEHKAPSKYDAQPFNRILQNNPDRYEYGVIWASEDCTDLKLNKMEILFGKIYDPKFNFDEFGKGGCKGHSEKTKIKLSINKNTSGYFRVYKQKNKKYNQGFIWVYRYYDETGKRKSIISVDIKKLEAKVKAKGLKWECIKND